MLKWEKAETGFNADLKKRTNLLTLLFNKLTQEDRVDICENPKFKDIFKKKKLCSCCLRCDELTKCIHSSCSGACKTCRSKNLVLDSFSSSPDTCCACNKKQVIECLVCYEELPLKFMNLFKQCIHGVCWKCYSASFEAKNPIKKCPMCGIAIKEIGSAQTKVVV